MPRSCSRFTVISRLVTVFAMTALLRGAASAQAAEPRDESDVLIHVAYDVPRECPDRDVFYQLVLARTPRVRFGQDAAFTSGTVRRFAVQVKAAGPGKGIAEPSSLGYLGELVERTADRDTGEPRRVSGASCSEVVSALALTTALAIDPEALSRPSVEPKASRLPSSPSVRDDRRYHWVGIGVEGMAVGLPHLLLAGSVFYENRRREGVEGGWWDPSWRVTLRYGEGIGVEEDDLATYRLLGASGDVCPLRWGAGATFAARPCLGVDAAAVQGNGRDFDHPESTVLPWVAATAAARLAWQPLARLAIELEATSIATVVRPIFTREHPDDVVGAVSRWGFRGALRLSYRFP